MTTSKSSGSKDPVARATQTALRLLQARPRSQRQVEEALERRGVAAPVRAQVLAKLVGWGYLDDVRFARARADALWSEGRLGVAGIRAKLEAQRLTPEQVTEALRPFGQEQEQARARALLVRLHLETPQTPRAWARAARLLTARGFSEGTRELVLGEPPLDPGPEAE